MSDVAHRPKRSVRNAPSTGLAESVYQSLLEQIMSGRIAGGTTLTVVGVAKKLGVSRTPVHEALRLLAKDGLVEQALKRRAKVSAFTAEDVFDIFEMRKLLEGAAVEAAATRISKFDLARLRETVDRLAADPKARDWQARWIDHDEHFHGAIAAACGSKRLAGDIVRYRLLHRGINRIATDVAGLQSALKEHDAILRALEAGDAPAARQAMLAHIGAWQAYFVRHFPRS
jgi:DNA-binding GntR family transcriptional regulator